MHLIVRDSASLDEIGQPQDLDLPPGDLILLSFSDSDLAIFQAAVKSSPNWRAKPAKLPYSGAGAAAGAAGSFSSHFINLSALRHPISVDLFIEKTVPGSKVL